MSRVLSLPQREQAGSDSYNRFEYQVHWIVYHIIGKLQDDAECIVFCEFHDDMAEFSLDNKQYQFFQIKTKEESSDWTIAEMSKREKSLVDKKGVDIAKIGKKIDGKITNSGNYLAFHNYLATQSLSNNDIHFM